MSREAIGTAAISLAQPPVVLATSTALIPGGSMVSRLHRIIHEVIVSEYAREGKRRGRRAIAAAAAAAAAVTDFIARRRYLSRTRRRLDIAPRELHSGERDTDHPLYPRAATVVFTCPGETRLYALSCDASLRVHDVRSSVTLN